MGRGRVRGRRGEDLPACARVLCRSLIIYHCCPLLPRARSLPEPACSIVPKNLCHPKPVQIPARSYLLTWRRVYKKETHRPSGRGPSYAHTRRLHPCRTVRIAPSLPPNSQSTVSSLQQVTTQCVLQYSIREAGVHSDKVGLSDLCWPARADNTLARRKCDAFELRAN